VHIHKLGFAFGTKSNDIGHWLGLRIEGITVSSPKSHFARRVQTASKRREQRLKQTEVTTQNTDMDEDEDFGPSESSLRKIARVIFRITFKMLGFMFSRVWTFLPKSLVKGCRKIIVRLRRFVYLPLLHALRRLGSHLASFVRIGCEVRNVKYTVEQVFELRFSSKFGIEMLRHSSNHAANIFLTLSKLHVRQCQEHSLEALSMPGGIELDVSFALKNAAPGSHTHLTEQIRCFLPKWLDVSLSKPSDPVGLDKQKDAHARTLSITARIEEICNLARICSSLISQTGEMTLFWRASASLTSQADTGLTSQTATTSSPANYHSPLPHAILKQLRCLRLSLPHLQLLYNLESPPLDRPLQAPLGRITTFSTLDGLKATLLLGSKFQRLKKGEAIKTGSLKPFDRHRVFIGAEVPLAVSAKVGWKSWKSGFEVERVHGKS